MSAWNCIWGGWGPTGISWTPRPPGWRSGKLRKRASASLRFGAFIATGAVYTATRFAWCRDMRTSGTPGNWRWSSGRRACGRGKDAGCPRPERVEDNTLRRTPRVFIGRNSRGFVWNQSKAPFIKNAGRTIRQRAPFQMSPPGESFYQRAEDPEKQSIVYEEEIP